MSNLLDDLARSLATPMPRRRALRTIGAALAVGAIPALRPERIGAEARRVAVGSCPGSTKLCWVKIPGGGHGSTCYYPQYEKCCIGPNNDPVYPNKSAWVCGIDETCGKFGSIEPGALCTCTNRCKDGKCCPRSKGRCVNGSCCPAIRTTFAPGTSRRGVACCPPGTIAVPGRAGECCPKGDLDCCTPKAGSDDDLLAPLGKKLRRGQLCVKGNVRNA